MTPAPPLTDPDEPPRRPLVVTDDPAILDDLLRLAAAADVDVEVAADAHAARRSWGRAPLVAVGADQARSCTREGLPRRADVVLVGVDLDDAEVWEQAVRLGAEHVVFLPDAEGWLVDAFADAADPVRKRAVIVGVVGGRGGAGASCLAVALALAGQRRGLRCVLVDADPLGGGIDLAVGAEELGGLRWPDFASARGRVPRRALVEALPRVDDLSVLSWSRSDTSPVQPEAMQALLTSARRGTDLVVVDLPRSPDDPARVALTMAKVVLLVVPAEVRATAAAHRVCVVAGSYCGDIRAVVRQPGPANLSAATVADALGLPLAGVLRAEPGLAEALERGEPPGSRRRGPLARFSGRFIGGLGLDAGRAA
jgi:secretion/DNA translocation related CpaE-like protein